MSEILFDAVTFTYPGASRPALDAVTEKITAGTFALVVGPTGSGKSTLLRAINGLVPHFAGGEFTGRVLVDGRDTRDHAPRALADVVAFVPQDPGASFVLDRVEDELAYAMENLGFDPRAMRRRIEEVLDLLALAPLRDRSVQSLSGGERQRVAIAAALTPGASILVLDEPTSQLDPQGAEDVLSALHRLAHDHGVTIVCAEHRLERVAGFADVVLACRGGKVTGGDPRDILAAAGLGPPVAVLGVGLGWEPVPLTVREARRSFRAHPPDAVPRRRPSIPGEPLATLEGVSIRYGATRALEGVDLTVERGRITAIMGRNGSGKTTLLRCLAGLRVPDSGRVTVNGRPPRPGRDAALCPQEPDALLFAETAQEEIAATLRRHPGDALVAADRWLEQAGLASLSDRHPRDLSMGERALIAVVAVAAAQTPLLLLDEPTRGVDPHMKARLRDLLRSFADDGIAIVVATHDVELAAAAADRIVLLAGGEIIGDGPPQQELGSSAVFSPQMARVSNGVFMTVDEALAGRDR